jgi:hypothetical protein
MMNKVSAAVLFLAAFIYVLNGFYTGDIRARQIRYCRELVKFSLTLVDERASALPDPSPALVRDIVRAAAAYFDPDAPEGPILQYPSGGLARITVFESASGKVVYPLSVSGASVEKELFAGTAQRIEGELDLGERFGYFARLQSVGLTFFAFAEISDLFSFHSKTLYVTGGLLVLFCLVIFLMDARRAGRDLRLLGDFSTRFEEGFRSRAALLERVEDRYGRVHEQAVRKFNEMALRGGNLVRRLEDQIRSLGQQRNNLKKLIVLYRKYAPSENLQNLSEQTVSEAVSRRQDVSSLTLELVDFVDSLEILHPEVVSKELSGLHSLLKSDAVASGGIVNYSRGHLVNLVYGVPAPDEKSFLRAVEAARRVLDWVGERNGSAENISGVKWSVKMGLCYGSALTGVVGENYMVLGRVVEESRKMLENAKRYGVPLVTDHQEGLSRLGAIRYRKLDVVHGEGPGTKGHKSIYEVFIREPGGVEDAIKLYEHGIGMFFEGRYEMATLDFKKVNQLIGGDNPSLIFLQRCERLGRK